MSGLVCVARCSHGAYTGVVGSILCSCEGFPLTPVKEYLTVYVDAASDRKRMGEVKEEEGASNQKVAAGSAVALTLWRRVVCVRGPSKKRCADTARRNSSVIWYTSHVLSDTAARPTMHIVQHSEGTNLRKTIGSQDAVSVTISPNNATQQCCGRGHTRPQVPAWLPPPSHVFSPACATQTISTYMGAMQNETPECHRSQRHQFQRRRRLRHSAPASSAASNQPCVRRKQPWYYPLPAGSFPSTGGGGV